MKSIMAMHFLHMFRYSLKIYLLAFILSCFTAAHASPPILVGLLPDDNPDVILKRFEPVRIRLEQSLNRKVKVVIPSADKNYSYDDLVNYFVKGKIDVAYLGGFSYLKASSKILTTPIAMRKKDTKFRSYFIARPSLKITSLAALKGHSFSFGSVSSTSGHLMPRFFLNDHGIDSSNDFKGKAQYSGTHSNTLNRVMTGKVDAGVLNSNVFDRYLREGKVNTNKVEVVWVTPGYSDYVWVARESLDIKVKDKLSKFFIGLIPGSKRDDGILNALNANYYITPTPRMFARLKEIAIKLKLIKED